MWTVDNLEFLTKHMSCWDRRKWSERKRMQMEGLQFSHLYTHMEREGNGGKRIGRRNSLQLNPCNIENIWKKHTPTSSPSPYPLSNMLSKQCQGEKGG